MIADNIWDMILGKSGKLPGEPAPEIVAMAKEQGREFYTGNPQELYPDKLDAFRDEMKQHNWELGQDEEELFELAMHPEQYRAYKSGEAKKAFEADLAKRKAEANAPAATAATAAAPAAAASDAFMPKQLVVNVDNEEFVVNISYPGSNNGGSQPATKEAAPAAPVEAAPATGAVQEVLSPLEGKFFLTKESSESPLKVGDTVKEGDLIGYIESMKTYNAVTAEVSGRVAEICFDNGASVDEDDILVKLQ